MLRILIEVDQIVLLVSSVVLLIFSLSFTHDVVVYRKKTSTMEVLFYIAAMLVIGRPAIEGLISCWNHWF